MLARVKAALDARRDGDMLIVARTDAAGVTGVDEAIARCRLFMAAGADAAKPQGIDAIADIKRVIAEVAGPHFATISQAAGPRHRSLAELEEAGVATVSFPSVALFAAAHAVRQVAGKLKRERSLASVGDALIPLEDYYGLVGLRAMLEREEGYDRAAASHRPEHLMAPRRRREPQAAPGKDVANAPLPLKIDAMQERRTSKS
jgi:2-methylisocitrate lyase-like PEP mutase family enzyme